MQSVNFSWQERGYEAKPRSAEPGQLESNLKNVLEQMCETAWDLMCSWLGAAECPAGKGLASQSLSLVQTLLLNSPTFGSIQDTFYPQIPRSWALFLQMLTAVKISRGKTIPMTYLIIQEPNKFNVYDKIIDTNSLTWAMEAWGFPIRFLNVRLDTHFSWWRKELAYVICRKTPLVFILFPEEMLSKCAFVSR